MKTRAVVISFLFFCFTLAVGFPAIACHFVNIELTADCEGYAITGIAYVQPGSNTLTYSLSLDQLGGTFAKDVSGEIVLTNELEVYADMPFDITGSWGEIPCGDYAVEGTAIIEWQDTATLGPLYFDCDCVEAEGCRVTAGGNKDGVYCPVLRNGQPDPDYCVVEEETSDITHTWGGQAGAPPRIDGNWTHKYLDKLANPHDKFTFHSNELFYIQCSDPGQFCQPARFAPNRQIDFAGIGRFTNTGGEFKSAPDGDLCFKVHLEDIGEPGPGGRWPNAEEPCTHCPGTEILEPDCTNCTDYYEIEIYDTADHNVETGECLGNLIWQNGDEESPNCTGAESFVAPFAPYEGFFTRAGNVQMHPDNNGP